jgi:FixJ family two-component response regulator
MSGRPVFVVDDDASVRRALERLLRAAGYEVRAFASAREILARDDAGDPACVVVDVRMPGQGGLELYEALVSRGRAVSVIFMTGHGEIPMAVKAMEAGAVDFLTKPFTDEALLDAIARAIAGDARRRDTPVAKRPIA